MTPVESRTSDDALGAALHHLRMTGVLYCHAELRAPWGFSVPAMPDHLWFHVVTSGTARLVAGPRVTLLQRGDLVLVNQAAGHSVHSGRDVPAPHLLDLEHGLVNDRYMVLRHDGGGPLTTFICGAVRFDAPTARHLIAALPEQIHIQPVDQFDNGWMLGTSSLMAMESGDLRPGGEAVITRLADILVIQAIRTWLRADPAARDGWLGAMSDHHIGRAISLLQRQPERGWTVAELAEEVAMSRAAFAARFAALVGEPPMHYLTRWRMYLALDALENEGSSVKGLAHQFGYRSEAAFSRTFKRVIGCPPGSVRRGRRGAPRSDGAGALRAHHGR